MRLPMLPIDSPPDQSETLKRLQAIETTLRVCHDGSDWEIALSVNHAHLLQELWQLVLDVVCSPLWVRIRAAELLNVCFALHRAYLRIDQRHCVHYLRSILSSSCQVLDELDPKVAKDDTQLVHWMAFLHNLLTANDEEGDKEDEGEGEGEGKGGSPWLAQAVVASAQTTYASLAAKMLRLLGNSSTKLFAMTTCCVAALYRQEIIYASTTTDTGAGGNCSVLLDMVLCDPASRDNGIQHFGGALLHVLNACGYPCPVENHPKRRDILRLLHDILGHVKIAEMVIFSNDFKVLVDIVLRENTDLPLHDLVRKSYLMLLDQAIASPLYLKTQLYRKHDILKMLQELLEDGMSDEETQLPSHITQLVNEILIRRIDRLD